MPAARPVAEQLTATLPELAGFPVVLGEAVTVVTVLKLLEVETSQTMFWLLLPLASTRPLRVAPDVVMLEALVASAVGSSGVVLLVTVVVGVVPLQAWLADTEDTVVADAPNLVEPTWAKAWLV